jgi:hypothetical protein
MTQVMINKRIGLAMLLIMPLALAFAQTNTNSQTNARCIIENIIPSSAIVKINGHTCKKGATFNMYPDPTINMPDNAIIRYKELGSDKRFCIIGKKLNKMSSKTLNNYKQLNTKGATDNLEAIKKSLEHDIWLMISDTAYIQFPAKLNRDEFFVFKSIPHFTEYKPNFNYENQQIIISKSDLNDNGIYFESDSIIQFQVEVHNSHESVFVTDCLRIKYIQFK